MQLQLCAYWHWQQEAHQRGENIGEDMETEIVVKGYHGEEDKNRRKETALLHDCHFVYFFSSPCCLV